MLLKRYKNIEEEGLQRAWKSFENSGAMVSPFLYYDYMKWIFNGGFLNNRGYKPFVECVENEAGEILAIFPMKKSFCSARKSRCSATCRAADVQEAFFRRNFRIVKRRSV